LHFHFEKEKRKRMALEIVDSHHHFWSLSESNNAKYKWLGPVSEGGISWHPAGDVNKLKQSYVLDDYLADTTNPSCHLIKSVHVQAEADDPIEEVKYLEQVANNNPGGFPHGIVAHANLASPKLPALLESYTRNYPRVKGVRQLLNWSNTDARFSMTDRGDYLTDPTWLEGLQLLTSNSLSFDMHVYPSQMVDAAKVARQNPNAILILDHCGLPVDGQKDFKGWQEGMKHMAEQTNVVCKLSGLVMFNHAWSKEIFAPYILECLRLFTPKRCMFGSNFPVDRLNITYEEVVNVYRDIAENEGGLTKDELNLIFKENAIKTYRLEN
jgi:predicted TIM-barrel fold metal-dependent hydrolase